MKHSILIAEDEPLLRQLIGLELEENGFEVLQASDGAQALAILEKSQPDLILLDLLMPRVDGYDVLRALRKQQRTIPVLVLSNLDSPSDQKLCKDLGAKGFFVKSNFESGDLMKMLQQYLPVGMQ